eukprot:CAMPEP_0197072068 /NCGR_PEP_ID=MMETSP1384-20130603/209910_1 /TAXON_ID=29189 /ORGANISM="Ammonia sp." /LENGTH=1032 /DNA_ID=CAMNT_0042510881 /DNA_START=178 /DNA_END=3276 /DNA_ORIENTATION=-
MVRSESELSRMTKRELMQWLTKHDQRLPPSEKLKKYYLQRAVEYFRLLQTEQESMSKAVASSPSRSQIKHKGTVISNERTKKKLSHAASQQSKTPTSVRQTVRRTQRRHSAVHAAQSPSPSLTRSKRKVIKIKRKTPSKQSPSLSQSMKKTRERVRRATADPARLRELEQEVNGNKKRDAEEDDEEDEDDEVEDGEDEVDITGAVSENEGDFHNMQRTDNLLKRKFVCRQDPEKMTISNLQAWLDENSIDFEIGQRKQNYVNLVKQYSLPSSSIDRHRHVSSPERSAPLPRNLRMSPLTPQDDEKNNARSRIPEKHQQRERQREAEQSHSRKSGSLLLTPALNKTGVSRLDTPSKLAMRDEIRNLLGDDSEHPLRPMKITDDGVTPGGPSNYDEDELNNVLSDLRREKDRKQEHTASPAKVKVFHPKSSPNEQPPADDMDDNKEHAAKPSNSYFSSFLNAISPHKAISPTSMKESINGVLSTSTMSSAMNTDKKRVHRLNRTLPSPVSSPADSFGGSPVVLHDESGPLPNNGNFSNDALIPPSPMINDSYNQEEDLPQTPAITNCSDDQNRDPYPQSFALNNPRRSNRLKKKFKAKSPPNVAVQPTIYEQQVKQPEQQTVNARGYHMKSPTESSGVSPSIPVPPSAPTLTQPQQARSAGAATTKTLQVLKWLFPAVLIATMAWIFLELDGMSRMNQIANEITDFIDNLGAEKPTLFCDTRSTHIAAMDGNAQYECEPCPKHAVRCSHGRVVCQTNYILRDNKCILDGVLVKFAFEIKSQAVKILSERRGKYECGEIDVDGYTMNEDELLSNVEIIDAAKKHEAFLYFKERVLPDQALIGVNDRGKYFSYKSIKSPICKINEWIWSNCKINEWMWSNVPFLVATLCLLVVLAAIYCNCRKKQNEKKELELMVNEIYKILEEYRDFDENKHVPVDIVRQRMKPKSNSNKLWREVENRIYKDCRITKSVRMIDGMQRNCWKLSSVSMMNRSNSQMKQSEMNVPNNTNQHPGFTFMRSNEAAEEPRFPAYSKRAMW